MHISSRNNYWIIGFVVSLLVFLFFFFVYPYHLFHQEQIRLFMITPVYLKQYFDSPGWLLAMTDDFLIQFFYFKGAGPAIISALCLLLWGSASLIYGDRISKKRFQLLIFLFIAFQVALLCRYNGGIGSAVSLIYAAGAYLLYRRIKHYSYFIYGFLFSLPFLYWMFGGAIYLITIPALVLESKYTRLNINCFVVGFFVALLPLLFQQIYLLPFTTLYVYPLSGWELLGTLCFLIFFFFLDEVQSYPQYTNSMFAFAITLFGVLTGYTIWKCVDFEREELFAMDSEYYFGNWERVHELAAQSDRKNPRTAYFYNLSAAALGKLPEKLLEGYQPGSNGLFLNIGPQHGFLNIWMGTEVHYLLKDWVFAEHQAMLGILFSKSTYGSRMTRKLAGIALERQDSLLASKYLNMLSHSIVHGSWASRKRSEKMPDFYPYSVDSLRSVNRPLETLRLLVQNNPQNKTALDYLLCYEILNKDLLNFRKDFETFYPVSHHAVPSLYQQAILICLAQENNPSTRDLARYGIEQQLLASFKDYVRRYDTSSSAMQDVQTEYRYTYWFYYHYATFKKEL